MRLQDPWHFLQDMLVTATARGVVPTIASGMTEPGLVLRIWNEPYPDPFVSLFSDLKQKLHGSRRFRSFPVSPEMQENCGDR